MLKFRSTNNTWSLWYSRRLNYKKNRDRSWTNKASRQGNLPARSASSPSACRGPWAACGPVRYSLSLSVWLGEGRVPVLSSLSHARLLCRSRPSFPSSESATTGRVVPAASSPPGASPATSIRQGYARLWRPRVLITVINANDTISRSNGQP
jgi:hypothetical protein